MRRVLLDPLLRARRALVALHYVLAAMMATLGMLYLGGGSKLVVASRAFVIFVHFVPGGLRGHGVVLVALAVALLAAMRLPRHERVHVRLVRYALSASAVYFLWTASAFLLAPYAGGDRSWSGVVIYTGFALLALILQVWPPPARAGGEDMRLLAAALQVRIEEGKARALVDFYLHGGDGRAGG